MVKSKWVLIVSIALVAVLICSAGLIKNVSADNEPTERPTEGMGMVSQDAVRYGTGACGEGLTWTLDESGRLTIEGTGAVTGFDSEDAPWSEYAASVRWIFVKSGVTAMGSCGLDACVRLEEVTFEGDAPAFDADTFAGVTATVFYPGANETWTSEVLQNYGGSITWIEN